jgi:hypothetical protein
MRCHACDFRVAERLSDVCRRISQVRADTNSSNSEATGSRSLSQREILNHSKNQVRFAVFPFPIPKSFHFVNSCGALVVETLSTTNRKHVDVVSMSMRGSFNILLIRRQQGATWIVKPAAKSRGKGIFLFRKLKDLAEWKNREIKQLTATISTETYVVQRYIDNPYLVAGLNENIPMRCFTRIRINKLW